MDLSEDDWDRVMAVNVKSIYLLSREVIPHMEKQGAGSIINTSSGWGLAGGAKAAVYCASKGAVVLLTKAMAIDHGPRDSSELHLPWRHGYCMLRAEAAQLGEDSCPFSGRFSQTSAGPRRHAGGDRASRPLPGQRCIVVCYRHNAGRRWRRLGGRYRLIWRNILVPSTSIQRKQRARLTGMVQARATVADRRRELAIARFSRVYLRACCARTRPRFARLGPRRQRICRFHDVVRRADSRSRASEDCRSGIANHRRGSHLPPPRLLNSTRRNASAAWSRPQRLCASPTAAARRRCWPCAWRELIPGATKFLKFEGHYHGWYDPYCLNGHSHPADQLGPKENPTRFPDSAGIPESVFDDVVLAPWNDLEALEADLAPTRARTCGDHYRADYGEHGLHSAARRLSCKRSAASPISAEPFLFSMKS